MSGRKSVLRAQTELWWVRFTSWWPDVFAGLLAGLCTLLLAVNDTSLRSVSVQVAFGDTVAYVWLAVASAVGFTLSAATIRRNYTVASIASSSLAVLLAMNALMAILWRGDGVIVSVLGYSIAAILLVDRAKQLQARVPEIPMRSSRGAR